MSKPLEARDVIKRLCELQSKVASAHGYAAAADCFCGCGGLWGMHGYDGTFAGGYRNDGEALAFIEAAVREKLAREVTP